MTAKTLEEKRALNAAKARRFRAQPSNKGYYNTEEAKAYRREWKRKRKQTKEGKAAYFKYSMESSLKKLYGITLEEWNRMLIEQSGLCALCWKPMNPTLREPAVDHCHKTGKVRGLLHTSCNAVIGHADDSADVLRAALEYLDKHKV